MNRYKIAFFEMMSAIVYALAWIVQFIFFWEINKHGQYKSGFLFNLSHTLAVRYMDEMIGGKKP